jgi:hypothetical protein
MPPYYPSLAERQSAISAEDTPTALRTGNAFQDKEYARYQLYVRQALARGLIDEKTAARVLEDPNHRNVIEKILRFEPSGSDIMQPFVDIFSLDNYAMASLAHARNLYKQRHTPNSDFVTIPTVPNLMGVAGVPVTNPVGVVRNVIEDPFGALGAYTLGFSIGDFWKAWKKRTSFSDVLGYEPAPGDNLLDVVSNPDFLLGLGMDIALSPSTWLTFGIGGGTKVAAAGSKFSKAARAARSVVGAEQKTLTMSRWGGRVYKEAVREMLPKFVDELEATNRFLKETGNAERQTMWGTQEMLQRLHAEVVPYMEKNYNRLAKNVMAQDRGILSRLFSEDAVVTQALRGMSNEVPSMERLYKETAPLHRKELGFWSEGSIGRMLARSDRMTYPGKFIHGVGRRFSQTWGLDPEAKQVFEAFQNTVAKRKLDWERMIKKDPTFVGLTEDQARAASFLLDSDEFDLNANNAAGSIMTAIGEVSFDERALQAARRARDLFKEMADEEQKFGVLGRERDNYLAHMMKENIPFLSLTRANGIRFGAPGFSQHRSLATLGELINETKGGEKLVETNLIKILHQRKMMSLEHVYTSRFNDHLVQAYGMPYAMINSAQNGISKQLRDFFAVNRHDPDIITDLDQVWAKDDVTPARLGFSDSTNQKANREVIKWMTSEKKDYSKKFITDRLQTVPPLGETVHMQVAGERKEFNINLILEHLYEGTPLVDDVTPKQMGNAMMQLDEKLRQHGVPLRAVFPDIDVRIFGGSSADDTKQLANMRNAFRKSIDRPMELASSAQWPQWMLSNAVRWRQKMGIFTDVVKPIPDQLTAISKMVNKIGFTHDELMQYLKAKYGIDSYDKLTARMADNLHDTLRLWTGHRGEGFNVGVVSPLNERLRIVEIPKPKFFSENNLPEVLDRATAQIDEAKSKVASIDSELQDLAERRAALKTRIDMMRTERKAAVNVVESDPRVVSLKTKYDNAVKQYKTLQEEQKILRANRSINSLNYKNKITRHAEERDASIAAARKTSREQAKPIRDEIPVLVARRKAHIDKVKNLVKEKKAALKSYDDRILYATGYDLDELKRERARVVKTHDATINAAKKDAKKAKEALLDARKRLIEVYNTRKTSIANAKKLARHKNTLSRTTKKDILTPIRARLDELDEEVSTARDIATQADTEHAIGYARVMREKSPDMEDLASSIEEQSNLKRQAKGMRARYKQARTEVSDAKERLRRAKVSGKAETGNKKAQREILRNQRELTRLRAERQKLQAGVDSGEKTAKRYAGKLDTRISKMEAFAGDVPPELKVKIKQPDLTHIGVEIGAESPIGYDEFGPTTVKGLDPWQGFGGGRWYLPDSIATLMEQVHPSSFAEQSAILKGYDFIQNFFKAPLMAPWIAFFKRNAVTNTMLAYTKAGLALLHPKHLADSVACISYYIANNGSDLSRSVIKSGAKSGALYGALGGATIGTMQSLGDDGSILDIPKSTVLGAAAGAGLSTVTASATKGMIAGATRLSKLDKLANRVITFGKGEHVLRMTVAQAVDEMEKRGVFWTHVSKDIFPSGGATSAAQSIGMSDMFRAGELVSEIPTRMMLFLTVAGETGSLGLAAKAVKDYLFDFSSLTNYERRVMRRAIPFYSWMKHSMDVSFRSMVEQPSRVMNPFRFARDANTDYDPADTPDWLQERLHIISKDNQGNLIVKTNLGLAQEDTAELLESLTGLANMQDSEKARDALQLLARGPFGITSALEWIFNKDTFIGKQIRDTEDSQSDYSPVAFRKAPEWIQRAVDYKKVGNIETINPTFAWLMGELPYSRFINAVQQVYEIDTDPKTGKPVVDANGNVVTPHVNYESLARTILAERLYKYDPNTQKYYRDRNRLDQMTLSLKRLGVIRQYTVTGKAWKSRRAPALKK